MTAVCASRFYVDEARIPAMSPHGLTVDWEDNPTLAVLSVDSRAVIRAVAGQGKSFPQNINRDWGDSLRLRPFSSLRTFSWHNERT
jgi:hypothetical protein